MSDSAPSSGGQPLRPVSVRLASALIYAGIALRILQVFESMRGLTEGRWVSPGGLGMPLLFPFIIVFVVITRRFVRRGYSWARNAYSAYALLRMVLLIVRGSVAGWSALLLLIYPLIVLFLFLPTSNRWYLAMAEWRRGPGTGVEVA